MIFTRDNFVAMVKTAIGTPYQWGGIDPFHGGADCSGLIYWAALQFGVTLPRSTEAEWAGLPHVVDVNLGGIQLGDIVEFQVPSDSGAPPQHVGVWLGPDQMIADPQTGSFVNISSIPNDSTIWPIGYCQLPFVPDAPPTIDPLEELFAMITSDPAFAVRFLYRICLHREVDGGSFTTDVNAINAGMSLNQIMTNIQDSPEGKAVIAAERKALGI